MTITPLSSIADMADGLPVICIEGTVKYAGKVSAGKSDSGNDWSRQFFVLAQNGAEVGVTLWGAAGNEVKKGEHLRIENTQNKKKQWTAITKQSYEKDGKLNHTLEIRAEHAKIKLLSNGGERLSAVSGEAETKSGHSDRSRDDPPTHSKPFSTEQEPESSNASAGRFLPDTTPAPLTNHSTDNGINEARQHIMRSVNLYNLCVDAVDKCIKPHIEGMTAELYQAAVGTLFIEASRAGLVSKMPTKPVPNGNEKVERMPVKQELEDADPHHSDGTPRDAWGDEEPF